MRWLCLVLFALASPFLWNCSENDTPAVVDETEPGVRICYPYDSEPTTFVRHRFAAVSTMRPSPEPN
jgi:hypothetical protein